MEDEDEVDVEGDFDINIGTDHETLPNLYIDINEPPSKSANLLPEYTQHPWMLEQGWSLQLDHVADEKSKAAIEKMLQEEQQYMNGKVTVNKVAAGMNVSSGGHKHSQQKRAWTEEERVTFLKGLEIYGRSWSKIADLIPGKTVQQVKSFGQHYFKMKAREEEEIRKRDYKSSGNAKTQLPIGIQNAIRAVTTAQPTVRVSPKKLSTYYSNASSVWTEPETSKKSPSKLIPSTKSRKEPAPKKPAAKRKTKKTVKIKNDKIKNEEKSKSGNRMKSPGARGKDKKRMDMSMSLEPTKSDSIGTIGKKVEEKELNVLIDGSEVVRIPRKEDNDSSDSDVDIDIDVESDEEVNVSAESGYPDMDMVYKRLVESAGINNTTNSGDSEPEDSEDNNSIHEDQRDRKHLCLPSQNEIPLREERVLEGLPHTEQGFSGLKMEPIDVKIEPIDVKVDTSDEQINANINIIGTVVTGVEVTNNLERYPSIGSIFESQPESSSEEETGRQESVLSDQEIKTEVEDDEKESTELASYGAELKEELSDRKEDETEVELEKERDPLAIDGDEFDSADSVDGDYDEEEHSNEFGILTSLGEVVYLPNPTKEALLEREMISDLERKIHCEFFTQKPGAKTPDRYLKIRNFILDAWTRCRPQYLNKTSVRPGLKNCGDVNCIGRIHSYLEQTGAINFGCIQVQYRRQVRSVQPKVKATKDAESTSRTEFIRVRKRRVRDIGGEWVDEKDLEGKTIEHKEKELAEKKPRMIRVRSTYDPFKLIPCQDFSVLQPAPYKLTIESRAMVSMDIHAHMSKTEVIGLLGGEHSSDLLHVSLAVPCESISTGMQCEMDPVSQTEACDMIQAEGQRVVGWYHSHPTFIPNPSCRDIETQEKYQDWFGKGGNPFVGVIVSPYCPGNVEKKSIVRCLMVLNSKNPQPSIGVPHQFDFKVVHDRWDRELVRQQVTKLVERYSKFTNRVHLLKNYSAFTQTTCLEKMIASATENLPESFDEDREDLGDMIRDAVVSNYSVESGYNEGHNVEGKDSFKLESDINDHYEMESEVHQVEYDTLESDCNEDYILESDQYSKEHDRFSMNDEASMEELFVTQESS